MGKKLTDAEVLSPNALENISRLVGIMTPFVSSNQPAKSLLLVFFSAASFGLFGSLI